MKKRSKKREQKKNEKRKKAKRKLKEKRKQELGRKIAIGQTGRTELSDEVDLPQAFRSLAGVDKIDILRPSEEDDCICGSRLKFGSCCANRLHDGSNAMTVSGRFLNDNQPEAALIWCRAHLSWFILCHRAHTIPLQKTGGPIAKEILNIDIEALNEILNRLERCYSEMGRGDEFPNVLDAMDGVVDDQRWADQLTLLRASWWELQKNDPIRAAEIIAGVDIGGCRDAEVLAKYVTLRADQLQLDERLKLSGRVCEMTDKEEIKLQFSGLIGIWYLLVCEEEKGVAQITSAADRYRLLQKEKRSLYGDNLFARTLFLLGSLQGNDELLAESEKCFAKFLEPERFATLTPFGKGAYLMQVGRCKAYLGDNDGAIEKYDESLSICDLVLARIYKAEALVSSDELDSGRLLLEEIDTASISMDERHDYAMARTILAMASQGEKDIENAKLALKAFEATDPLFIQQRDKWLIKLLETEPSTQPGGIAGIIRAINRYIILQPNYFGVGINLNRVVEDSTQRGE